MRASDRNTKYFHHKASQRKKRNYVKGLFYDMGTWCDDVYKIKSIFTDYFSSIFTDYFSSIFTSSNPSELNLHDVLRFIDPVI